MLFIIKMTKKEFYIDFLIGLCLACFCQPLLVEAPIERPENSLLGWRVITAYSSCPEETDDTPFITASGQEVRKGIIATNELPIGTLVEIDGEIYEVQDRMNARYDYRIDIWMPSKEEALAFGKQIKRVFVYNN